MAFYTKYKNMNYKKYILPRNLKLIRYFYCIYLNKICDIQVVNQMLFTQNQKNLNFQIKKLNAKEEKAILKILQLKNQKRFLYKRRQKIIAAGLYSIDKFDALKIIKKEKVNKQFIKAAIVEQPSSNDSINSSFNPLTDPLIFLLINPSNLI